MNWNEIFIYRDGQLYSRYHRGTLAPGALAGCVDPKSNYCYVRYNYVAYLAHRIIFEMHHGYAPEEVDHIDRNPLNNRVDNLRASTRSQNTMNAKCAVNATGYKGVRRMGHRWQVRIQVEGVRHHIGTYDTPEEAAQAHDKAARKFHGEFASLNFGD